MASAIRYLAKAQFLGAPEFRSTSKFARKDQDIGEPAIREMLAEVPGVTKSSIENQLASLKKSGHYATIIREAQEEADAASTFVDMVHYQQRYFDSGADLVKLIYQLQIVVYGAPLLDLSTLERIQAETFKHCSTVNGQLRQLVLSNQVTSISGPNARREFIAAVNQRLETLDW